jgi:hypothetical protein
LDDPLGAVDLLRVGRQEMSIDGHLLGFGQDDEL